MENLLRKYVFVACMLFLCLALPKSFTDKIREQAVSVGALLHKKPFSKQQQILEIEALQLENALLSSQIQQVGDFLTQEERIESQFKQLQQVQESLQESKDSEQKAFFSRREAVLLTRLKKQLMSLNASVIYREPSFWNCHLWIDLGEKDNHIIQEKIIAINSPVVIGSVVIGVIDYVGEKKSRVRLITDTSLSLSARVVRGGEQNKVLLDRVLSVMDQLKVREDLFFSEEEQNNTLSLLQGLTHNIKMRVHERYLAKGEIKGSSTPLWRSKANILEGIGFNYDFEDVEGPARDLRTGEAVDKKIKGEVLVKEGDLLVTTGMDGIFPEGFYIGFVEKVEDLQEGAAFYNLKAKSLAPSFDELKCVTVLMPLERN
jgi:rod shape-determining protein MreC